MVMFGGYQRELNPDQSEKRTSEALWNPVRDRNPMKNEEQVWYDTQGHTTGGFEAVLVQGE